MIPMQAAPRRFCAFSKCYAARALAPYQAASFSSGVELGRRDSHGKSFTRSIGTSATDPPKPLSGFGSKVPKQFATASAAYADTDAEMSRDSMETDYSEPSQGSAEEGWLHGERPTDWWTGPEPVFGACAGVKADGTLTSLALPNLATCTRKEVLDYFDNTWAITEVLLSSLQGADTFVRPPGHNLRHPKIFYYGHPAVFYINKLRCVGVLDEPLNPHYECIFETGVDEMGWDDLSQSASDWPSVEDVMAYRRRCYEVVREVIETHPGLEDGHAPIDQESPMWALFMGFEHERIHIETSSVLIRELPLDKVRRPSQWANYHPTAHEESTFTPKEGVDFPKNEFLPVQAQKVLLGKPKDYPTYGWDNEYGHREMDIGAFSASKHMVTNGEFYDFVLDNGYQKQQYWTEAGWGWRTFRNAKKPTFWSGIGPQGLHQYNLRLIFDEISMPWDWPVDANAHEATAYCNWRAEKDGIDTSVEPGYRLLTEAEFQALRGPRTTDSDGIIVDPVVATFTKDGTTMDEGMANLNLAYSSSSPVTELPPTATGHHDVMGNSWQWCEDQFCALPGFDIHPTYEDFSTPCFDGEHSMIVGGSFMSTGANGASMFSRFSFRPHFFQHAGFRMVKPEKKETVLLTSCHECPPPYTGVLAQRNAHIYAQKSQAKELEAELDRQLAVHYGNAEESGVLPYVAFNGTAVAPEADIAMPFPERLVTLLEDVSAEHADRDDGASRRAFDIGCGVGGASFELARSHDEVVGLDISPTALEVCNELQRTGRFTRGSNHVEMASDIDRSRVSFKHADAMCIPPDMNSYDSVLCSHLLEYTASPSGIIGRMGGPLGLVKYGGIALIVSPYSWDEQLTPQTAWLNGQNAESSAEMASPLDEIQERLGDEFSLVRETQMPLLMRKANREFGLTIAHATAWKRNASA